MKRVALIVFGVLQFVVAIICGLSIWLYYSIHRTYASDIDADNGQEQVFEQVVTALERLGWNMAVPGMVLAIFGLISGVLVFKLALKQAPAGDRTSSRL